MLSLIRLPLRGLFICVCVCSIWQTDTTQAADKHANEPGWLPVVLARGALQEQIDATPIEERPYRPLHFYGNTVRRLHYRGTAMPRVGEVLALPVRVITPRSRTKVADLTKVNRSVSR